MVDADAPSNLSFDTEIPDRASAPTAGTAMQVEFRCRTGPGALDEYRTFCARAAYAPPQDPRWVESWARNCNEDIVVLTGEGQTARIAIALEIVGSGPLRIAAFPGGRHANANFPALAQNQPFTIDRHGGQAMQKALKSARPDIDLVLLERQAPSFGEIGNPLIGLKCWTSPNAALAVSLAGGFDSVLERASAKRKRKKHRAQTRKFEAAGGFRRVQASNRTETDLLLDTFFAMKAVRFAASGIADVFADEDVKNFFRDLFGDASGGKPNPDFVLHGLEVAGKLRAVTGCSVAGSTMTCEFGAIAEDELASTSPGDFLFFENIKEACGAGLTVYDFGVGDEVYKRLWCDIETTHFDVAIPVSAKGSLAVAGLRAINSAKRAVKSNPMARDMIRKLRRITGASVAT